MPSNVTFGLYKITVTPSDDESFTSFKAILDNPIKKPIKLSKNGNQFDLDGKVKVKNGLYSGTFCLLQTLELPTKAKFGTEPSELLNDEDGDTGLGHYTSFFYDPSNEIIAIQTNRNGVSPNGLIAYFTRNYKVKEIEIEMIINPSDLKKLTKLNHISSFEISIAKPESAHAFSNSSDPKSFRELTKIADETNGNVLTLHVGIGYEKSSTLSKSSIISYVRGLLTKSKDHEVKKIEIKGREGDEYYIEKLDLINNKVSILVTLARVRTVDKIFINRIISEAIKKYILIKPEINSVYKIKKN